MRKKQSVLGTLIIAAVIFIAGFMAYQHLTKPIAEEAEASKEWPSVEGIISYSELIDSRSNDGDDMYSADVQYVYSVDGNEYSGGSIEILDGSTSSISSVKETLRKYAVGTIVPVYYDPEFPNTAVLEPGTSFLFGLMLKLPLVFCLVSVLMVLGLFKRLLFGR